MVLSGLPLMDSYKSKMVPYVRNGKIRGSNLISLTTRQTDRTCLPIYYSEDKMSLLHGILDKNLELIMKKQSEKTQMAFCKITGHL
jgi:hypothetical protein